MIRADFCLLKDYLINQFIELVKKEAFYSLKDEKIFNIYFKRF